MCVAVVYKIVPRAFDFEIYQLKGKQAVAYVFATVPWWISDFSCCWVSWLVLTWRNFNLQTKEIAEKFKEKFEECQKINAAAAEQDSSQEQVPGEYIAFF